MTEEQYRAARRTMVDCQLRTSGVNKPIVLARMGEVPREQFVPPASRNLAYIDRAIPLANGRHLAAPLFYGAMLEEALPTLGDSALIVDAGSGYLTELVRPLVRTVQQRTPEEILDGPDGGGFSLVLIDGAVEQVPDSLAAMLAADGRMVCGMVTEGVTRLAAGRASNGTVALLPLIEMGIPRLAAFDRKKAWAF